MHAHEFGEIVMVFGGRALHVIGDESWPVAAGDVFVVGGSEAHEYREIKDLRLINILFLPENVRLEPMELSEFSGYQELFSFGSKSCNRRRPKRTLRLKPKELSLALNYADSLEQEIKMREPGYSFMALSHFMRIVCYLSRAYGISEKPDDPRAWLCVSKAIHYLEAHGDQPITVDELARLSCMSKRNFARVFQAATGSAPIAYLVNLRLARAGALLRRGEPVTSAAYKVGFNDSNYFTRRFHQMFGVAPSDYRKRQEPV